MFKYDIYFTENLQIYSIHICNSKVKFFKNNNLKIKSKKFFVKKFRF